MKNIASKVHSITKYCLYIEDEIPTNGDIPEGAIIVDGIMNKMGFHPGRIKEKREEVKSILLEMHEKFHKGTGEGWSFLNLCYDKNGTQWGEHPTMELLVSLAIACKYGKFLLPRDMWSAFPGGMPYVVFDTD